MKLQKCLFKAAADDNVATALASLRAGDTVPVLSGEGRQVGEVTLRAHVPIFFKVALRELHDGDVVRKWGHEIARVVSRIYQPAQQPGSNVESPLIVQPGMPVHIGNFVPSGELLKFWGGDIAYAANIIVEKFGRASQFAPYEFGFAKRNIAKGNEIRSDDIQLQGLRKLLLPTDNDFVVGRAVDTIAQQARLRLGCCEGGEFMFLGEAENVEVIQKFYRFLKGRFHEIA
jgi:hypothetical protein